jgi:hypothetical protein
VFGACLCVIRCYNLAFYDLFLGLLAKLMFFPSYYIGQVFQPWIQERKLKYTRHKLVMSGILKHLKQRALGRLLADDSSLDESVVQKSVPCFHNT